jgi:hypothetical protein
VDCFLYGVPLGEGSPRLFQSVPGGLELCLGLLAAGDGLLEFLLDKTYLGTHRSQDSWRKFTPTWALDAISCSASCSIHSKDTGVVQQSGSGSDRQKSSPTLMRSSCAAIVPTMCSYWWRQAKDTCRQTS